MIKNNILILIFIFSIAKVYSQSDLYIHYTDKLFDKGTSAFVKNELIIENDSIKFFETRYKDDFSDSIKNNRFQLPINLDSKKNLLTLINYFIDTTGVFCSTHSELKFDRNQTLFARRFQIKLNNTDYYLYDVSYDVESNISNDREKFERIMRAIDTCMKP